MPWTWDQFSGEMKDSGGKVVGRGYSGKGSGLNNPAMQNIRGIGPIPCGWYAIGPLEASHGHFGTNVAALIPDATNEMFGRGEFYLHGRKGPGDMGASEGCVVLDYGPRMLVLTSSDRRLEVTNAPRNSS